MMKTRPRHPISFVGGSWRATADFGRGRVFTMLCRSLSGVCWFFIQSGFNKYTPKITQKKFAVCVRVPTLEHDVLNRVLLLLLSIGRRLIEFISQNCDWTLDRFKDSRVCKRMNSSIFIIMDMYKPASLSRWQSWITSSFQTARNSTCVSTFQ